MDIPSPYSDPHQSSWVDLTGSSSTQSHSQPRQPSHSDEEIILASSRPKKRAGRTKFKETRHPVYRGIRRRNKDRWVCEIREPNTQTRIWLGTYPTADMAARAHDVAALALRGQSACLNFADSVWRLPVPPSKEAKDIRKTAMEAAEAFRPRDEESARIENVEGLNREDTNNEIAAGEIITTTTTRTEYYNDEETMLDMPKLIGDMAQGMMLSPPRYSDGDLMNCHSDDNEDNHDLPLWSYSF